MKDNYNQSEEVLHKMVTEGITLDYEIMTRRLAAKLNATYKDSNRPSMWLEVRNPRHIKELLEEEFTRLQQSLTR